MTKLTNKENINQNDISLTDILQAHDILISILLGKIIAKYNQPDAVIAQILKMTDMQDVNENAKNHIKMLLEPLTQSLKK